MLLFMTVCTGCCCSPPVALLEILRTIPLLSWLCRVSSSLKNGHDATNQVADQLYAVLEAGTISEGDVTQVLATDLLWGGDHRKT